MSGYIPPYGGSEYNSASTPAGDDYYNGYDYDSDVDYYAQYYARQDQDSKEGSEQAEEQAVEQQNKKDRAQISSAVVYHDSAEEYDYSTVGKLARFFLDRHASRISEASGRAFRVDQIKHGTASAYLMQIPRSLGLVVAGLLNTASRPVAYLSSAVTTVAVSALVFSTSIGTFLWVADDKIFENIRFDGIVCDFGEDVAKFVTKFFRDSASFVLEKSVGEDVESAYGALQNDNENAAYTGSDIGLLPARGSKFFVRKVVVPLVTVPVKAAASFVKEAIVSKASEVIENYKPKISF